MAKLLRFYEKIAAAEKKTKFETSKTEEAGSKLRTIGEIEPEWFERWIGAWLAVHAEKPLEAADGVIDEEEPQKPANGGVLAISTRLKICVIPVCKPYQ